MIRTKKLYESEGTDPTCGFFLLCLGFFAAIEVGAMLLYFGMPVDGVESLLAILSVPWTAFLYLTCRKWHNTKLHFRARDA